jgi:uncharacterized protein YqeY
MPDAHPLPSALHARLQADLTEAIRSRDGVRSATLRMALTSLRSEEVAGASARALSEDDVLAVLSREARKRREAAAAFDGAGRGGLADRERAELAVLEAYLPAQLGDDELAAIVTEEVAAAAAQGACGPSAMGKVMKAVQARVAGGAEGGRVAALVREQLTRA